MNRISFPAGLLICLVIFSHREIVAFSSDPAVAVQMSLGYLSGQSPPLYPPGMAFYITASRYLGVPLRVLNTALLFTSFFYMGNVLFRCAGLSRNVGLCCAIFAIAASCDPTIVNHADITANSLLSGMMNIIVFFCVVEVHLAKTLMGRVIAVLSVVLVSVTIAISRPDWQIVGATMALMSLLAALYSYRSRMPVRVAGACMVSLLTMVGANHTLSRFNAHVFGVQGPANYLDSRYSEFFAIVAALPSPVPTDRYYLADASRRELAYTLSPTLDAWRNTIERRVGRGAVAFDASKRFFGISDIANAFYFWHLDNVFDGDQRKYLPLLGVAAREIQARALEKRIPLSYPYGGVLSRKVRLWLPYVPHSIAKVYNLSFRVLSYTNIDRNVESDENIKAYNTATLRRAALVSSPEGNAGDHGWIDRSYKYIFVILKIVFIPLIAIGMLAYSTAQWRFLVAALGTLFALRLAFYALLDAGFYTTSPWYLMPNHLIVYPLTLAALLGATGRVLRHRQALGRDVPERQSGL